MLNTYLKHLLLTSSLIVLSACGGGDTSSSSESGSTPSNGSGGDTPTEPTYDGTTKGSSSTDKLEIHNVKNSEELRKALQDATSNHKHDKIILSAGTYKTTAGNVPGTFTYNDSDAYDLTITAKKGLNRNQVIIDGDKKDRIFHFSNTSKGHTVIVRNMTIKNGYTKFSVTHPNSSSAIYSGNTQLVLQNLLITNNIADSKRHKIVVDDDRRYRIINRLNIISHVSDGDKLVIQNCDISNNSEAVFILYLEKGSPSGGGGVYMSNSIVKGNTVSKSLVNAIFANFKSVQFTKNVSSDNVIKTRDSLVMDNSTISQNNSHRGLVHSRYLSVENTTIKNNISGGYLIAGGRGSLITNSVVSGNKTDFILSVDSLINSTVNNNEATNTGSSVHSPIIGVGTGINTLISGNSSKSLLFSTFKNSINNTFYNNQSSYSSTRNSSILLKSAKVLNTVLAKNKMQKDAEISHIVRNTYLDQNKLNAGSGLINRDNIQSSTTNINLNADGTLKSSSIAINNGLNPNSQGFKDVFGNDAADFKKYLSKDRKGHKRVHGGTIDMGAFEY